MIVVKYLVLHEAFLGAKNLEWPGYGYSIMFEVFGDLGMLLRLCSKVRGAIRNTPP